MTSRTWTFRTWFRRHVLNRPQKQQPRPQPPRPDSKPVTVPQPEPSPGEPDPVVLNKVELPTPAQIGVVDPPPPDHDVSQTPLPPKALSEEHESSSRSFQQPIRPFNDDLDVHNHDNDDADNEDINTASSNFQPADSNAIDTRDTQELDSIRPGPSRSPQRGNITKSPVNGGGGFAKSAARSVRTTKSGTRSTSRSDRTSIVSDISTVWSETGKVNDATKQVQQNVHSRLEANPPPIASRLNCDIIVHIGEHVLGPRPIQIFWLETDQHDRVKAEINVLLKDHVKGNYGLKPSPKPILYRTSAVINLWKRITETEDKYERLASSVIEHKDHWNGRVPALVAEHSARNLFKELKLEVVWHFDVVVIGGPEGSSLADKIWNAVDSKLVTNWINQSFLPKTSLDGIFEKEIIRELIKHDASLSEPGPKLENGDVSDLRKWLLEEVYLTAVRLIAICIFAQKPLSCLRYMMTTIGLRDTDLPLTPEKIVMPRLDLLPLIEAQKKFNVYNFDAAELRKKMVEEGKYEIITPDTVVPITKGDHLGDGGFGIVDEVFIHPDHHTFDERTFALKELRAVPLLSTAFKKEHRVISNLMNVSHTNILLPLAMWRQANIDGVDKFYMLYPKAQRNLKDYMKTYRKTPALTRDFVEHLMLQIWNLTDALESMHLLSRRLGLGEDGTQSSLHPKSAETRSQHGTYHHDLKPDNILVFADGTWKISDFGTAGITQAISGPNGMLNFNSPQLGDPVYSPPDLAQGKYTARGYDIWCFGCILLEILLTVFQDNTPDHLDAWDPDNQALHRLEQFYIDRADSVQDTDATALFWFKTPEGGCVLRQPVIDRFEMLRRRTKEQDQFDVLTELAINMMSIDPAHRPSAMEVAHRMKTLRAQVLHNLKLNETFYLIPGSIAQPWASRKTTEEGHYGSSPTATADLLSNGVPSIHTRHRSLPEQLRVPFFGTFDGGHEPMDNLGSTFEMTEAGTSRLPTIQVEQYPENVSVESFEA